MTLYRPLRTAPVKNAVNGQVLRDLATRFTVLIERVAAAWPLRSAVPAM